MSGKNSERPRRFLVVSTTGIGDTLMSTPAVRALREGFPESQIHLLVHSKRKELFIANPHVDRILKYRNNPFSRFLLFLKTFPRSYDHVLVFHANDDIWRILRVIRYGKCLNRQGFSDPGRKVFSINPTAMHSIRKRLSLVEKLTGRSCGDLRYELSVPEAEVRWAAEKAEQFGVSRERPLVGLQLGAADPFKCWPLPSYAELAARLQEKHGVKIYLNTSKEERGLVSRFSELGGKDFLYLESPTITQSAAMIKACSLFISPDTGPMHMAVGMGVPLVALFCPTTFGDTGPLKYEKATVLRKEKPCSPCLNRECPENFCMAQISVEEVYQAAARMLGLGNLRRGAVRR